MGIKRMLEKARMALFPFKGLVFRAELFARVFHANTGLWEDIGKIGDKMVTTAGVEYLVTCFQGTNPASNFKYHASGTDGTTPEAIGNTALGGEVETRATGVSTSSSGNVYRSVATIAYTDTRTIAEHGLFSQLASGGTLWDRTIFTGISVLNGDSIEWTYSLTINAGG